MQSLWAGLPSMGWAPRSRMGSKVWDGLPSVGWAPRYGMGSQVQDRLPVLGWPQVNGRETLAGLFTPPSVKLSPLSYPQAEMLYGMKFGEFPCDREINLEYGPVLLHPQKQPEKGPGYHSAGLAAPYRAVCGSAASSQRDHSV